MENIVIRETTLKDLPTLLEFEQGIILAERPYDNGIKEGPVSYYDLETLIKSIDSVVIVAEYHGKIISSGIGMSKKSRSQLQHEYHAYLGLMYTYPDYRGKSVNGKLIEGLKEWATSQGLSEIRLTVYNDNLPAIKAYEKVGFKRHIIEMRLK